MTSASDRVQGKREVWPLEGSDRQRVGSMTSGKGVGREGAEFAGEGTIVPEAEFVGLREAQQRIFWAFSNELRTPLNVIVCYNDLMASEVLGALNEGQSRAVSTMAVSINQLRLLVDSIFELGEFEFRAPTIAADPVDLSEVVGSVIAELGPLAEARGLYLRAEGETPLITITDAARLRRLLISLSAGALEQTGEGGVTLRVRRAGEGVSIDVIDTGHGLDQEGQSRIFRMIDDLEPAPAPAALHLALAYRLALLIGGDLEVASEKGVGSTYSLHLPVRLEVAARV